MLSRTCRNRLVGINNGIAALGNRFFSFKKLNRSHDRHRTGTGIEIQGILGHIPDFMSLLLFDIWQKIVKT